MDAATIRRRWDPVVKFTHWSVAIAVLANAVITEEGSIAHVWVGYALAAVLGLRLLWGIIGPHEARFRAFPPSPGRALEHINAIKAGRQTHHASHNPLGALMVYTIWGTLGVIIASGIAMSGIPDRSPFARSATAQLEGEAGGDRFGEPERSGDEEEDEEGEEGEEGALGEVHEVAVNLLYLLILLHLAGVLFESRRSGRHIVMAMLPGQR